jgi:arginase
VGLLWFDAHPDFDTPDEHLSGYLDGMGVATMAGQCWRALTSTIPGFEPFPLDQLLYCGIRDFSPGQWAKVRELEIPAVAGRLDGSTDYQKGLAERMADYRHGEIMIHLDVDCLDISVGMANEYAAAGGLSAEALNACLETACAAARPISLTIASFNPNLDGAERISAAAIRAARAVAEAA